MPWNSANDAYVRALIRAGPQELAVPQTAAFRLYNEALPAPLFERALAVIAACMWTKLDDANGASVDVSPGNDTYDPAVIGRLLPDLLPALRPTGLQHFVGDLLDARVFSSIGARRAEPHGTAFVFDNDAPRMLRVVRSLRVMGAGVPWLPVVYDANTGLYTYTSTDGRMSVSTPSSSAVAMLLADVRVP